MHHLSKLTLAAALSCLAHVAVATAVDGPSTREASPPTYAYAKCVYKPSTSASNEAGTRFEWGVDENGDRFKIPGYWWSDQLNAEKNMFVTDYFEKVALQAICEHTLEHRGRPGTVIDVRAGYDEAPYDYTFWSEFKYAGNKIDRIIVFGDSFSDTSRTFKSSLRQFPHTDSWTHGRFSNGMVWSEYVGKQLSLPVYSWAVSDSAYDAYYAAPSLRRQVSTWLDHMERVESFQPERALYVIWVGMDSAVNHEDLGEEQSRFRTEILRIHERGGRHIAVLRHPDLSTSPLASSADEADYQAFRAKVLNAEIDLAKILMKKFYDIDIHIVDTQEAFTSMVKDPEKFGFKVSSTPCLSVDGTSHAHYLASASPRPGCTDANTHVFWDMVHPTTKAHQVIGDSVAAALWTEFASSLPWRPKQNDNESTSEAK